MNKKCLIVVANYYENISNNLLQSALRSIKNKLSFKIIYVPGVFEIPITISKNLRKYDGFIALGCVIKGQTPHFEFISSSVTDNILNMSAKNKKPIGIMLNAITNEDDYLLDISSDIEKVLQE